MKKSKQNTVEQEPGIWTIPVTNGAAKALRDHHKLINPLICQRAQELAQERAASTERLPGEIVRSDVEQAIIESQSNAIEAQALRIRDLVVAAVLLQEMTKTAENILDRDLQKVVQKAKEQKIWEELRSKNYTDLWREACERMARQGDVANLIITRDKLQSACKGLLEAWKTDFSNPEKLYIAVRELVEAMGLIK